MLRSGARTFGFQFLIGAEAAVGFSFAQETVRVLSINSEPLRLAIRRVRAFDAGAFVPVEA